MPAISIVIETFTISHEYPLTASIEDSPLRVVLDRLQEQTYPLAETELILMIDEENVARFEPLQKRFPRLRTVTQPNAKYFSMKNLGIELAQSPIVALLDADCVPTKDWVERVVRSINNGADVVVGKTRYRNDKPLASTFSVFDFGHVQGYEGGRASYFNANNLAFKTEVARHNPFDLRARRNGACYHLWQRLAQQKLNMVYDSGQFASHGYDIEGWGFIPKHLERGFDAINFFRIDETGVMPGTRYMWLGILAPVGMAFSRILFDFKRIITNRNDLGIRWYAIPYFYAVSLVIRQIEMIGGLIAIVRPNYYA